MVPKTAIRNQNLLKEEHEKAIFPSSSDHPQSTFLKCTGYVESLSLTFHVSRSLRRHRFKYFLYFHFSLNGRLVQTCSTSNALEYKTKTDWSCLMECEKIKNWRSWKSEPEILSEKKSSTSCRVSSDMWREMWNFKCFSAVKKKCFDWKSWMEKNKNWLASAGCYEQEIILLTWVNP